jgi:XTP/dITP diphosphohydrolase
VRATLWPSILIATTNPGKVLEIVDALAGLPVRLLTLRDLAARPAEPEETGTTFAENAALKARAYAYATGLPTVAEDSGLAIDVLGGRPGVHSARYPGTDYHAKFTNLYAELSPHPRPWTARFVCALAFVVPQAGETPGTAPVAFACEATVEGEIAGGPSGSQGFGYDPIFFYPPYGATLGDVDTARKLAVSHRGAAFRQFRAWLHEQPA